MPDYRLHFRLLKERHYFAFTEDLEVHILELPKFIKSADELQADLDIWLYFLRYAEKMDTEALPEALARHPLARRAVEDLHTDEFSRFGSALGDDMEALKTIQKRLEMAHLWGMHVTEQEVECLDALLTDKLLAIASSSSGGEADVLLRDLGDFQTLLATISYGYKQNLGPRLERFVYVYDRWDLEEVRMEALESIKRANFPSEF